MSDQTHIKSILDEASAAGINLSLEGDDILLESDTAPPNALVALVRQHKSLLLSMLRGQKASWQSADWQAYFDERAAILEFEAGLNRKDAEAKAFECCVTEYINQTHTASNPDVCAHCGTREDTTQPLIPLGTEKVGHVWVHCDCLTHWQMAQGHEAAEALRDMGITPLSDAVIDQPSSA